MKDLRLLKKRIIKILRNLSEHFSLYFIKIDHLILIFLSLSLFISVIIFYLTLQIQKNKLVSYENSNITIHDLPVFVGIDNLDISAKSAIVLEKDSRTVVYSKNKDFRFSPASSAKIMTAIVSLENYRPDDVLEAANINIVKGSKMGLYEGERMKMIDLQYGLLLPSGNDAAFVLANNFPGGISSYVAKMNDKSKELHLYNTYFTDPSGFDDGNFTTAFDLALLTSYALNNKTFQDLVKTKMKIVYNDVGTVSHTLENLNKLLSQNGVIGVKTGYTEEAGGVLVASVVYKNRVSGFNDAFSSEDKTFIIVVLKSQDRFADTQELISKVVKNVQLLKYN